MALTGSAGTVARLNAFGSTKRNKNCPNCRDRGVIVYDNHSGDELCSDCGQILESRVMSEEQEWRSFSNSDGGSGNDRSRVGGVNDSWLEEGIQGTSMIGGDKRFTRLIQTHELTTSASSADRLLKTAFNNLRIIGDHFGLKENALERCKEIVKDLQTSGNLRTRTGITYMLAVVYLACREEGMTWTLKELTSFDRTIQEKEIGKAVNKIKKTLPQKNLQPMSIYASAELVAKIAKILQLAPPVIVTAQCIAKKAEQSMSKGTRPNNVAAAAIYMAAQLHNIQQLGKVGIAQASKSGYLPMLDVYKEMLPSIRTFVPRNFVPLNVGGFSTLEGSKV